MHVTFDSLLARSRRLSPVIAATLVISLAGCDEPTAPQAAAPQVAESPSLTQSAVSTQLKELGADMETMTSWSLITLGEGSDTSMKIVGILNGLKGHMLSGKLALCQDDVNQGRAWYASLTETQQLEQGNISITLDLIQSVLDQAGQ